MRQGFLFVKLILLFSTSLCAQLAIQPAFQHLPAEKFGTDICTRPVFSKDGALWCFTETNGFLKYNGYSVQQFKRIPGNKNSIISDTILAVYFDENKQEFWMAYYAKPGITCFNVGTGKYKHYLPDSTRSDALPEVQIVTFKHDNEGKFWILTWGKGLVLFDAEKGKFKMFAPNPQNKNDSTTVAAAQVKGFTHWKGSKYLIGYFGGSWPSIYDAKTKLFTPFPVEEYLIKCNKGEKGRIQNNLKLINNIYVDKNQNIWFCSYSGLVFFDTKKKQAHRVSARKLDASIGNVENTRGVIEDERGRLWVLTLFNGFMVIDPDNPLQATAVMSQRKNSSALQSNTILSLKKDPDGNIWISTGAGGFTIYQPLLQEFDIIPWDELGLEAVDASSRALPVNDMHMDENGLVYISHGAGMVVVDSDRKQIIEHIKALNNDGLSAGNVSANRIYDFRIEKDKIWLANYGVIEIYDRNTKQIIASKGEKSVLALFQNGVNNSPRIFRGRHWPHLVKYNESTGLMEMFFNFPDSVGIVGNYSIKLNNGNWLLPSGNNAFVVFDPETKKWDRYCHTRNHTRLFPDSTIHSVCADPNGIVWICTPNGIYSFHHRTGKFIYMNEKLGLEYGEPVNSMAIDKNGTYWLALRKELYRYNPTTGENVRIGPNFGLQAGSFLPYNTEQDNKGRILFKSEFGFLRIDPAMINIPNRKPIVSLSSLVINEDTIHGDEFDLFTKGNYTLAWDENFLALEFHTNQVYTPSAHRFFYRLKGVSNNWQDNGISNRIRYTNLSHGSYVLEVKAVNAYSVTSKILRIPFTIQRPFWLAWWFYVLLVLLTGILIFIYIKIRERAYIKQQQILEAKIEERTAEVVAKAREIQMQKDIIEEKNKELTDSIYYAQRIQQSVLPDENTISKNLPSHFIFFRPKDIVSGDFYWFTKQKDSILWAVVDCTGHGVPGGFMSMLGSGLLNQIVNEEQKLEPDEILNHLRDRVMIALKQTGADGESRDGMDISLCRYIISENKLQYAGANNSLYMVRNNELKEVKADKQPIGIYIGEKKPFTRHELKINKGDLLYMSSDGYADQFGGQKGKKFKSSSFEKLLSHISPFDLKEQYNAIESTFMSWKGDYEQLDDVCVIGVKL